MNKTIYVTNYLSKIGALILLSDGKSLIGLYFSLDSLKVSNKLIRNDNLEIFKETKKWLDNYFNGKKVNPKTLKILLDGTDFRNIVWNELLNIPYGETLTYKQLGELVCKRLGKKKMSAQAIGGAVGHNPIPIIIPCHRVIGSNGTLTGYSGGIEKKKYLLELEKASR